MLQHVKIIKDLTRQAPIHVCYKSLQELQRNLNSEYQPSSHFSFCTKQNVIEKKNVPEFSDSIWKKEDKGQLCVPKAER